ncbi:hypothetical protein, partial [Litoreibacter halocynthiae]|uniref:hypothetical protein n=1 Tax=Litoreibacter halocynthiae TaxID=1242689 RepID=UPI00249138C5
CVNSHPRVAFGVRAIAMEALWMQTEARTVALNCAGTPIGWCHVLFYPLRPPTGRSIGLNREYQMANPSTRFKTPETLYNPMMKNRNLPINHSPE